MPVITAELILGMLLCHIDRVDGKLLKRFRTNISRFKNWPPIDIYCDTAGVSIHDAVAKNPTFFQWDDEEIIRSKDWEVNHDYIITNFGRDLNDEIKGYVRTATNLTFFGVEELSKEDLIVLLRTYMISEQWEAIFAEKR